MGPLITQAPRPLGPPAPVFEVKASRLGEILRLSSRAHACARPPRSWRGKGETEAGGLGAQRGPGRKKPAPPLPHPRLPSLLFLSTLAFSPPSTFFPPLLSLPSSLDAPPPVPCSLPSLRPPLTDPEELVAKGPGGLLPPAAVRSTE